MAGALTVSTLMIVATVMLVAMAILIIIAIDRINQINGSSNANLQTAKDRLTWAQITAWIAAGMALLLVLGYFALHVLNTSEWLHLILWILLFAALIISLILLAISLSDVDNANLSNNNGATNYIWAALIVGVITFVLLLISGGWRIATKQSEGMVQDDQYYVPYQNEPAPPSATEPPQYPPGTNQVSVTTAPMQQAMNQPTNYGNGTVPATL